MIIELKIEFEKNKPVDTEDNEILIESLRFKLYFEENLDEFLRVHNYSITVSEVVNILKNKFDRATLKEKALYKKKAKIVLKREPDLKIEQIENDFKSLLDNRPNIVQSIDELSDQGHTPT